MNREYLLVLASVSMVLQLRSDGVQADAFLAVPDPVIRLLGWPSPEDATTKAVTPTATNAITAVFDAERWLRLVVDAKCLPTQIESLCMGGEFGGRDTVRHRWAKAGRSFLVAQTASVFVVEIRPQSLGLGVGSKEERVNVLRGLCRQVLAECGKRWTGRGEEIVIGGLNDKVVKYSFDPANAVEMAGARPLIMGRPKRMGEEGVERPRDEAEARIQDSKANAEWDKTAFAWMYWFRNVHWFADDERLVLYFLKEEGGPVKLSFAGGLDSRWFTE